MESKNGLTIGVGKPIRSTVGDFLVNSPGLGNALKQCFISPNVADSNSEPANMVDALDKISGSLDGISEAIRELAKTIKNMKDGKK